MLILKYDCEHDLFVMLIGSGVRLTRTIQKQAKVRFLFVCHLLPARSATIFHNSKSYFSKFCINFLDFFFAPPPVHSETPGRSLWNCAAKFNSKLCKLALLHGEISHSVVCGLLRELSCTTWKNLSNRDITKTSRYDGTAATDLSFKSRTIGPRCDCSHEMTHRKLNDSSSWNGSNFL